MTDERIILPPVSTEPNVVSLPERRAGVKPLLASIARRESCMHALRLDYKARTVSCDRCGCVLDAFEAISFMARNWDNYAANRDHLRAEGDKLQAAVNALRKEVSSLRAKKKRALAGVDTLAEAAADLDSVVRRT